MTAGGTFVILWHLSALIPGLRRSCVMSGSSEDDAEGGQWPGGVAAVVAERSGDGARLGLVERADDEVAQAGHDVGAVAGADLAGVFAEGDVADVVQAVLDAPVAADEVGQSGGAGLGVGQAGDGMHHNGPPLPCAQVTDLAGELDDLGGVGTEQ
jgi:hypothetical protein